MNKTSTFVTLAAATALSAGVGLVSAAPAHAATTVWDRVAACESGGNWSINTGNGFYGGLQFTHSTWQEFGGGRYAYNANQASRAEQIAIAKKVLVSQGPGAWPVCSRRAGLTRANGLAVATTVATPVTKASTTRTTTKVSTRTVTTPKKTTTTTKTTTSAKGVRYVTVKRGDTLSRIAKAHGFGANWRALWRLNSGIHNPNAISVGQQIRIA